MITTDEVDAAFTYLNDTIEEFARAKSYMVGLERQEKTILSEAVVMSTEKTQGMREAMARVSKPYKEWCVKYQDAVYDFEIIRAKRRHADMTWERWRSEFSAAKQGVVL